MYKAMLGMAAAMVAGVSSAAVEVGKPAPNFTLTDSNGNSHSLADFKGKKVVLEWHNPECPFVKKHYTPGNMQKQQTEAAGKDVVWLSINSGAPGKQGHLDAAAANAYLSKQGAKPAGYLIDADGKVGKTYGAKTTPHMYVIDAEGVLRYVGAIDSNPSADSSDIASSTQYIPQVLAELASGKAVSTAVTQPYGCSVKYAN